MNTRQKMVTEALWKTLVLCYTEPGDRSKNRVPLPPREAVSALLTCAANVLSSVENAAERQKIMAMVSPALDRAVSAGRSEPEFILPPERGIVLPH